ncbi:hypothetical protein R82641_BJNNKPBH_01597 [Fructobacillus cardui]|uniref:Uncharacterized protein n=1 Tax=Fructobacillus cardui TaxID=2893170 RepID=A0ABN9Z477_9LACO|nr:hypothetical protein R82641_BJNNKPBH_01597 [Fructobacillus cardui]
MNKKYYWKNKQNDNEGKPIYLIRSPFGYISQDSIWQKFSDMADSVTAFTEEEVVKWGHNPDMFYREEVE